ncbi:MAG: PAS domain-containing protein [Candidatus Omnitrophica bacterium]|nr:PAS domain-containing protein [Candidatus Omnitrophota bacterium]
MSLYLIISNLIIFSALIFLLKKLYDQKYSYLTFRRLIDSISVGYYRCRYKDGIILSANRGFLNILGIKSKNVQDIIGRAVSELIIYVDSEESMRQELKMRGELKNHEYHFKTLDGKDRYVLCNSYVTRDPYTREEVVEALMQDVTEERISYERMKESQERYEKLFKNSGDMVIICKLSDYTIEEVNPVTEIITGYAENELLNKPFVSLFHPSVRKDLFEIRKDLLFKGSARIETIAVCRNGSYKEVILTFSVVEIKDDRMVMAVVKDVSLLAEKKEEENRRKQELEEFWRSAVEREERIKELREDLEKAKNQIELLKGKDVTG